MSGFMQGVINTVNQDIASREELSLLVQGEFDRAQQGEACPTRLSEILGTLNSRVQLRGVTYWQVVEILSILEKDGNAVAAEAGKISGLYNLTSLKSLRVLAADLVAA